VCVDRLWGHRQEPRCAAGHSVGTLLCVSRVPSSRSQPLHLGNGRPRAPLGLLRGQEESVVIWYVGNRWSRKATIPMAMPMQKPALGYHRCLLGPASLDPELICLVCNAQRSPDLPASLTLW
jgi:hypothetical protein